MNCTVCKVELTTENCLPSSFKHGKKQCRLCLRKRVMATYYKKHDTYKDALKRRYKKSRLKYLKQIAERRRNNREFFKIKDQQRSLKAKLATLAAYGDKCACCGEAHYQFLTIDHVNNDGAEHRRTNNVSGAMGMYLWLKRNGYPKDFQVLCMNCNCAKAWFGVCPHQTEKMAVA